MTLETGEPRENIIDWIANRTRVMKAGLRNRDDETVATVFEQIKERFGPQLAEFHFVRTVNRMMDEENFSFVDDGEVK